MSGKEIMELPDQETKDVVNKRIANFWLRYEPIQTLSLLQRLAEYINQTLTCRARKAPGVQSPPLTLSGGTGS